MSNQKKSVKKVDNATLQGLQGCVNLSQRIRYLHTHGWSKGDIARFLTNYEKEHHGRTKEVRFQHVRNVIITPIKGS